ncbi:MAG TPA: hypothetical protein VEU76_09510 [Candidatus Udaeobacter sp.]|nr:hypothetical protein [Candidatus Udaeobacter sp.]
MLDALVAVVVLALVVAGVLVMIGPSSLFRRFKGMRRTGQLRAMFEPRPSRDVVPSALNPKTQRVLVAAARLATWLRAHGQEEMSREIRGAAARMAGNEPAGLYALQTALRHMRVVNISDSGSQERLKALAGELRTAVQDRFEQLELLPFRKP